MNRSQKEIHQLIKAGFDEFSRIFMIYDHTGRQKVTIGDGILITPSMIHIIEAIGKEDGVTVTSLSRYFMITKGAVSQILSKLIKNDFVIKQPFRSDENEQPLSLTDKGLYVFRWHEENNKPVLNALLTLSVNHTNEELKAFVNILRELRQLFETVSQSKTM
jgi:DNA-binding MarR family transcriptional regulator